MPTTEVAVMKTNRSITASILAFILFFYWPSLIDLKTGSFLDNTGVRSLRQRLISNFQYVFVLKTEKKCENDVPEDDAPVYWRLNNIHFNNVNIHILFEKSISPIQISLLKQSPRSPPII